VAELDGWRYCPRCAASLKTEGGCAICEACGFRHYAHSAIAVAAFVEDELGRLLLARRADEPDAGRWDSPGGFLEEGEDPLIGLRRELLEETSLTVEPGAFLGAFVDTYGSEPGAPPVLNLVYEAAVVAGDASPADDVSELRWFARDELPDEGELAFRWLAPAVRRWAAGSNKAG
jgi:8-oxo-dGTP diphosphatase